MSTDSQNLVEVKIEAMQEYLISIGFEHVSEIGQSAAFRHVESGSLVTLTGSSGTELIRPADFLSVKYRLESEGLVSDAAVAEMNLGRLPIAS